MIVFVPLAFSPPKLDASHMAASNLDSLPRKAKKRIYIYISHIYISYIYISYIDIYISHIYIYLFNSPPSTGDAQGAEIFQPEDGGGQRSRKGSFSCYFKNYFTGSFKGSSRGSFKDSFKGCSVVRVYGLGFWVIVGKGQRLNMQPKPPTSNPQNNPKPYTLSPNGSTPTPLRTRTPLNPQT